MQSRADLDMLTEPLRGVLLATGAYLPRVAVAAVVLLAGWLLARAARFVTVRLLRAVNAGVITERAGIDALLRQGGLADDTLQVAGLLAQAVVLVVALMIAFNGLGLTSVTDLLSRALWFLPRVVAALLILVLGAYFARVVGHAVQAYCRASALPDADLLGRLARHAVNLFVVLIALDQLGVGGDIIRQSFLIVLGGVVLALALAFGIGGRHRAAALIAQWWPLRSRERRPP